MEQLRQIFETAARFREQRASLTKRLKALDERHKDQLQAHENNYLAKIKTLDQEKASNLAMLKKRSQEKITGYIRMQESLRTFIQPVLPWCPEEKRRAYLPNPGRVDEAELNRLIGMVREGGIIAWIKRTFRLGGYSSREEMSFSVYQKIEDACAYCQDRIVELQNEAERENQQQVTASRRKQEELGKLTVQAREDLKERQRREREDALNAIRSFDGSASLRALHDQVHSLREQARQACGSWGQYAIPETRPEKVQLAAVNVSAPDSNGIERKLQVPLMLNLYESNILVLTSGAGAAGADSTDKRLVRKLLARLLKTVPPEMCSYTVFDSLYKGASLERLIDVTNAGTTDLSFHLFTANDRDATGASCAERRKYLRSRPAEIIKFMAGRSKSLFQYNREHKEFEFPFTWVVDFNFPEKPDEKLTEDMKELFVNASAAGYSFVFVTTPAGGKNLAALAKQYATSRISIVDCDTMQFKSDSLSFSLVDPGEPEADQIYNFMTALKRFYDEGGSVDNRINSVLASRGITQRDASKKLTIPMALDSRGRLVDIEFGGEGSVHGFISGGTNSGKSTLLHTIILSACLHYDPTDLEIWLIDYKQTEFHLYKRKAPPHVKLIGVSKTADFTFSLLDKIKAEADRRTELMNLFDAQNLADYRLHRGEPGYREIPRLFLVIDEFHEMSQFVSSNMEYKDKLENILREYRAQGITCLMADQTFSTGLSGLTTAAKNQIGLRIAMRNEASPQEVRDTLEVDRAMYSDSIQRTIAVMSQGEFIMKVYVRNGRGEITDIRLEKFKGLFTKGEDIVPVGRALRTLHKGKFDPKDLIYVNTKEQVPWNDAEADALDRQQPIRYPNIRLYLGRSATLAPCFALDMGRQPNENLSIVGGSARQRFELLAAIMESCRYRQYPLLVFMAEYSDLMSDHGTQIRQIVEEIPGAQLMETAQQWCEKLVELDKAMDAKENMGDTVCLFVGLETANLEFSRLPDRNSGAAAAPSSFLSAMQRYAMVDPAPTPAPQQQAEFNCLPIIDRLFSFGSRFGARCIAEVSVYRQFSKLLKLKDMCRHKVAFSMSADDCLMYLGSSAHQKSIGQFAVYSSGEKEVRKLLPYKYPDGGIV